ncbi:ribbon-helix-helix protein, CopG family [Candidatus Magnetobacterium casense]|uniref:ribbon-helix-helix protein, CopG family n=1 Tax=Candidatus Magnetobacterium casense TaxID=1455061 RepID=UPI00058EC363|nr:ribbon-helix-helix protein, CopG family [Candidatus Magnetobacterium casensis]
MKSSVESTSICIESALLARIEVLARSTRRSKDQLIQEAISYYLNECTDLYIALETMQNPDTEYLDWEQARSELLNTRLIKQYTGHLPTSLKVIE